VAVRPARRVGPGDDLLSLCRVTAGLAPGRAPRPA